jgi:hypothetical protein
MDEQIAHALGRLERLVEAPVAEHPEIYSEVHALLQDALAVLDE